MGNVQSEAAQESETAKNEEERASAERGKADRGPRGTKHELGAPSPGLQAPEPKAVSQPLSSGSSGSEPGCGDKQSGAADMGKNHSKKSKLKLSSMWAQNAAGGGGGGGSSGGTKEAGLCGKEPGLEKRGLACLSGKADLQGGQSSGSVLQEELKGLKVALRPPPVVAPDPRDLSAKRASAKGKGVQENLHLAKSPGGLLLQPEKWAEPVRAAETPRDAAETEACWAQSLKVTTKEYLESEGLLLEPLPLARKQSASSTGGLEAARAAEDAFAGPRYLNERCAGRAAPFSPEAPPGEKKALLPWEVGPQDKEPLGHPDSVLETEEDSKSLGLSSQSPLECMETPNSLGQPQGAGGEAKAGAKSESPGAEGVSSEMMQEVLERGLNFLYKVTIQSGAWPPGIRTVKQKSGGLSSGISYADVLKQCPQKKPPAGVPVLPKALHHLTAAAGKKLPAFKGLDRGNPEELSPLSQLFFEHLKKATPKEPPPPAAPNQQVVTFFEELSAGNTKRPEWQRPRPPTPYPQRRKGQGRKIPKFGTAVSQVVAFLGSDPKCDWFVQDDSQVSPDEAAVAVTESSKDHVSVLSPGEKETEAMGSSHRLPSALTLEQALELRVDEVLPRPWRRPQGQEGSIKEMVPARAMPYQAIQQILSPGGTTACPQTEEQPSGQLLGPRPHSPTGVLDGATSAPCGPIRLNPDLRVAALTQARTKIRKQGPSAPKSKEKLKPSGQPKTKAPKGKGQKQWTRGYGISTSPLRAILAVVPCATAHLRSTSDDPGALEEETPLLADTSASTDQGAASAPASPEQDGEGERPSSRQWPAFQVADSCSQKCYCKHREQRKLPKNVVAWLNPSTNHLTEPPWVATAILAVSLVAASKLCLDSYEQQHITSED